ncbi:MAG: hypothetical protein PUC52_05610 [bacterium]|nr:hypothetical protein [bacterium]
MKRKNPAPASALRPLLLAAAASFCLLFLCANVAPLYARASRMPVLGPVVRVLRVGSGGERTDGVHAAAQTEGETVYLRFERSSEETDAAPVYTVSHLLSPNRLVLTLRGVRSLDFQGVRESLLGAEAVEDVYRAMIGDDSMVGLVIVLRGGYTCEVTERTAPASLSLRFLAPAEPLSEESVYYLRSEAIPYGEELGMLTERFAADGATQLKTRQGTYLIAIGQYGTQAEAEEALAALEEQHGGETGLYVSSGRSDEIPER